MSPQTEVRVAVTTGVVQVVVAFIALFGALATAGDRSSALPDSGGSPAATTLEDASGSSMTTATPSAEVSCASVIREYRDLVRLDPKLAASLVQVGTDGVSPIDVNPDARRCGINRAVLNGMR